MDKITVMQMADCVRQVMNEKLVERDTLIAELEKRLDRLETFCADLSTRQTNVEEHIETDIEKQEHIVRFRKAAR
jgi:hypothetical protein